MFSYTGSSCFNPGKSESIVGHIFGLVVIREMFRYQPDERRWWMTLVNDPTVWAVSNASMKSLIMGGWRTLMLSSIQEEC